MHTFMLINQLTFDSSGTTGTSQLLTQNIVDLYNFVSFCFSTDDHFCSAAAHHFDSEHE